MTAVAPVGMPKTNRKLRDGAKIIMAIWSTIVLTFLFIPILLVIRHSFNRGGSFIVWAHHYSTKWWGLLFNVHKTWNAILIFRRHRRGVLADRPRLGDQDGPPLGDSVRGGASGSSSTVCAPSGTPICSRRAGLGLALRNSFTAAIGGTAIAVVLGGLAGVALARRTGAWRSHSCSCSSSSS